MQSSKGSVGSSEEFAEVLRSSWIRRLHLKPTSSILKNKENPPPIAVDSPSSNGSLTCNQTAISTEESRTQSSNFNAPTTPLPRQDNPSTKLDTIKCSSFPGFGPFQLKNRPTVSDNKKLDKHKDRETKSSSILPQGSNTHRWNLNFEKTQNNLKYPKKPTIISTIITRLREFKHRIN
ncbi:hypothetical protein MKW94_019309 [Papaver nudicaule]|uniref:Uncharacterized protein n=1 Tax=Papaver nudicaule TaxID=74823 RepID=A0AA41V160_PAPNU|nr:hypothetical protein [Papaver nudicaule]